MKNKHIKIVSLGIFILLLGIGIFSSISLANINISRNVNVSRTVIRVDDDGDGDYTSIQDAIDNASEGDIIEVYSGTYDDIITVDKQLTLIGIDSELGDGGGTGKPLLNSECGNDEDLIHVKIDGCSISGFHIKSQDYCYNAILISSDNNYIFQNEIENTNFGVNLYEAINNRIYENNIYETHHGILVNTRCYYNQIYKNYMDDMDYGIGLHNFAEYNTIFQNTVKDANADGIELSRSNNNTIYENLISYCKRGIKLWEDDEFGDRITIYGNNIKFCDEGISVTKRLHKIYQNNITNCKYGILLEKIETFPPIQCCQNKVYENNIINSVEAGI